VGQAYYSGTPNQGNTMLLKALPFFISYITIPLVVMAALYGDWWCAAPFLWGWFAVPFLDRVMGLNTDNMDPTTKDSMLFWHKMVTWSWIPLQVALVLFVLWQITVPGHLTTSEQVWVAIGLGIATGAVGINFAHELVHQRNKWERWGGEVLLASVGYGHFATEHVYGHHVAVATPKDPVTARKGESLYFFLVRAIVGTFTSAWHLDAERMKKRGRPVWHYTNPQWRYLAGSAAFIGYALWVGGTWGWALFAFQSLMAIYQLEAVNYVEHYGLTRRYLGDGKFERVQPHHSWNSSHAVSNWFLINLQRHSDHHYRPDRRFPLLQHYDWKQAPQLPFGYGMMIAIAGNPLLWFWVMNKRVDRWRKTFYPDITDWSAYDKGTNGKQDEPVSAAPVTA
jgi:alkane 1-monooxygenase